MSLNTELSLEWILSSVGFTTAFAIGLWQYTRAQRQEKVSLLLPLITEFETDPELQAACHLFDYDDGKFEVNGREFPFKNSDLLVALEVVVKDDWPDKEATMREAFDRYFDFFGKLYSFVDVRLLSFRDLNYFYYYFELMASIDRYKEPGFSAALDRYLTCYRFNGCKKCLESYLKLPQSFREELQLAELPAAKDNCD